jgi:MFS family permease
MGTTNAKRLLWAGFFAIFASGVGFSVRTGILTEWASSYGFTRTELGGITGGGLWGFGLIILAGAFLSEWIGYGKLMVIAVLTHLLSAALQLATGQIYTAFGRDWEFAGMHIDLTYWNLYIAMLLFAIGNGICEAVVNPMIAALFPQQKTHYLNILHAGWPGGLLTGGALSYLMNKGPIGNFVMFKDGVPWVIQMSLFLVPVALYALLLLGQKLPKSEAGAAGIGFGRMMLEFVSPILLLLLFIHALVGYVELGTDSWIAKITGSIMQSPGNGMLLFIYTSALMFTLRFFGGPIEHRLSPLGLLFISGILGAIGLTLLGNVTTVAEPGVTKAIIFCVAAATVYACGKTFLWPTMLAVVSERYPKGGSLTIGAVGGIGMLSAGLLGGPAIGFQQDFYATKQLRADAPDSYMRYATDYENSFYGIATVRGLNGQRVNVLNLQDTILGQDKAIAEAKTDFDRNSAKTARNDAEQDLQRTLEREPTLKQWWLVGKPDATPSPIPPADKFAAEDAPPIAAAGLFGGEMALRWTAIVPAVMAVLYLFLIFYFKLRGGYTKVQVDATADKAQEMMNTYEG